jgi:UDP-N-acetylglucosamine 2-epimerase (non-hydrolysing)/GDP/UDP-N,N'-diacetylbacillosamine 2-epimerase (hydrolysing)
MLILGDRSETLVAAFAALQLGIPVAHIQGGEVSGSVDGIQRHAITKLSHLHFAETERARQTILRLGEEKWRVHRVGAPYLDFISQKLYTSEREVRAKFRLHPREPFLLVLQHSETTAPERSEVEMNETLTAVASTGLRAIVAYPCSDQGYEGIVRAIEAHRGNPLFSIHTNIPAEDFIGLQACASVLVGNSSAAIYEAPYLQLPAVSVGSRQRKRERENNIIDVSPERTAIARAIYTARFDSLFRVGLERVRHLYGDGRAYKRIVNILRKAPPRERLFKKRLTRYSIRRQFFDFYIKPFTDRLRI